MQQQQHMSLGLNMAALESVRAMWYTTSRATQSINEQRTSTFRDDIVNTFFGKSPEKCMVTGVTKQVLNGHGNLVAGHVANLSNGYRWQQLFGWSPQDLNSAMNGVLWHRAIEAKFSNSEIAMVWRSFSRTFQLHVLDQECLLQQVTGTAYTWEDLDGRLWDHDFAGTRPPSARAFSAHLILAIECTSSRSRLRDGYTVADFEAVEELAWSGNALVCRCQRLETASTQHAC